ncbi:hypothetical protein UFOVP316_48 [uncultured Caudovirales phage]|uniref:Uncharacterized protein n=1 Tax=uncultured Caudovirales phage TaxID=2100421 RepID=A0A6J5LWQ3_9CAUD|nr:hypothetical protein UFOVP316_48 [uncultured Caudovirales phage]
MTLNQIVAQITSYGTSHPQINTVIFGDFADKLDDADVVYPAMFFDVDNATFAAKQLSYTFSIYLLDRHLVETDALEVLSDMCLVAEDIVARLRTPSNTWMTGDSLNLTFFREAEPDFLAGVRIDATLTLPSINNRCQIP